MKLFHKFSCFLSETSVSKAAKMANVKGMSALKAQTMTRHLQAKALKVASYHTKYIFPSNQLINIKAPERNF